jgi:EAL domain-containing protein (putative c-di-GMP-specific phosphodiesterase class I)
VRAITNLCHCLNLKVVAEGVESPVHVEYLRSVECDIAQGYHYGRPMPALNFEAWLAAERDAASRASST